MPSLMKKRVEIWKEQYEAYRVEFADRDITIVIKGTYNPVMISKASHQDQLDMNEYGILNKLVLPQSISGH